RASAWECRWPTTWTRSSTGMFRPTRSSDAASLIATAVRSWVGEHAGPRVFCIGVCGSQGSGKSTACGRVAEVLADAGMRCVVLSLDDLYLPLPARVELAVREHPLLRTPGVPGTHDTALGVEILRALRAREPARLPRFDKA